MTIPSKYRHIFLPVKYFLRSYRALSDGKTGVKHLEGLIQSTGFLLPEWKVHWIGTCTILRAAIDMFNVDSRSCINRRLREEIRAEWLAIKDDKEEHAIFWDFLREERNNILHQYEWAAYEVWMDQDGKSRPARVSLFDIKPHDAKTVLVMRNGKFKGWNSLELLDESTKWVEARIFSAIRRAGFAPDQKRNIVTFQKLARVGPTLLNDAT